MSEMGPPELMVAALLGQHGQTAFPSYQAKPQYGGAGTKWGDYTGMHQQNDIINSQHTQQPASMLKTPPPMNLAPVGGITGEGGSPEPGGFMDTLMREYLNEMMKGPQGRQYMDTNRKQGEAIMRAVPQPTSPMGPR